MLTRGWTYKLKSGTALRTAIENAENLGFEGSALVIDRLEDCCKEAIDWATDEDVKQHFEDLLGLIDGEAEVIRTQPGIIVSEWEIQGGVTELVDERLSEFYDLCDDYRLWVKW